MPREKRLVHGNILDPHDALAGLEFHDPIQFPLPQEGRRIHLQRSHVPHIMGHGHLGNQVRQRAAVSPAAMVVAQFIISLPIITGFTMASIQQIDPKLRLQIQALGASRVQMLRLLLQETRLPLLAAVMAGFGSIISEVGASMMVGGNITDQTRVLTTAIVMENSRGEFGLAIALGIILMILVYLVNMVLTMVQQRSKAR